MERQWSPDFTESAEKIQSDFDASKQDIKILIKLSVLLYTSMFVFKLSCKKKSNNNAN